METLVPLARILPLPLIAAVMGWVFTLQQNIGEFSASERATQNQLASIATRLDYIDQHGTRNSEVIVDKLADFNARFNSLEGRLGAEGGQLSSLTNRITAIEVIERLQPARPAQEPVVDGPYQLQGKGRRK
jgi:hypothetical protein